jgi:hypothetical protein
MSSAINYYDYKMIIEQTVTNYYSFLGRFLPTRFSQKERVFYLEILKNYNIGQSRVVYDTDIDGKKERVLDVEIIIDNMRSFVDLNNRQYFGKLIYRITLNFSNLSRIYNKLKNIFMYGYNVNLKYRDGLKGIRNYIEIWDQTYMVGSDSQELENIQEKQSSVLFINDPKGTTDIDEFSIPVVLFDNRLGEFLGIPMEYWRVLRRFVLDCRSNLFLEIMKRWDIILVRLTPCTSENDFRSCRRQYGRTKKEITIWGNCPKFNEKVQTLEPSTIIFKNNPSWERENQRFKLGAE